MPSKRSKWTLIALWISIAFSFAATRAQATAPTITQLSITTGAVGATVTITGTNFGTPQGTSTVKFHGTTATVTSWSATSLQTTVPTGATTGTVVVTVSSVASNGVNFTVVAAPHITSLSRTSGAVGAAVTITGTNFGATQGTGTVKFNGTSATVSSWNATTIGVTVPTGATTGSVVVFASGVNSNGSTFTVTFVPTSWANVDVGAVGLQGSANFANNTYTIVGSGQGVFSNADQMHFAYQQLSGDGAIVARVKTLTGTSSPAAGVMIRETLNTGARSAYSAYRASTIYFVNRSTTDAASSYETGTGGSLPYWIGLVRTGNTFDAYTSPDGLNWVQVGSSQNIAMSNNVYIGLAVTSGDNASTSTATFDNVSINTIPVPAPIISSVSATTGSIGSQVVISGSGFGGTQGSSKVLLNGAAVTINSWSSSSITITIPTGATSGQLLVSIAPSMNDSNFVIFTVTTQPLPTGWLNQDVGIVGIPGSSTFTNGIFTVKGSGAGTFFATSDQIHFMYQPLVGDGSITARVVSLTGASAAQAGVMIRESVDSGASSMYLFDYSSAIWTTERTSSDTSTSYETYSGVSLPYWVRLVRVGETFTTYSSANGNDWTQLGTAQTITMAQSVDIGMAVTSRDNGALATATFDNVSLSTSSIPAPSITNISATTGSVGTQIVISGSGFGITQGTSVVRLNASLMTINSWTNTSITATVPSGATSGNLYVSVAPSMNNSNAVYFTVTSQPLPNGWLDQDIGAVGLAGSATSASSTFTVNASGQGPFADADQFHFVYQALLGDGSIVARVVSQTGSSSPPAGVMIRETLNSNAKSLFVAYRSTTIYLIDRASTGTTSTYETTSGGSLPYWVKLVRSGGTFTGYTSPDGVNWMPVGSTQTVSMAQNVYVGLAVSSDDNTSLSTATIDHVTFTPGQTPNVTSLSPYSGGVGTSVVVYGTDFGATQGTSTVSFNAVPAASVTSWSNTQITATIPATVPEGVGPVVVTVNSLPSNATVLFTAFNPIISNLAPPSGPTGGVVILNGSGFGPAQGSSMVQFNGINTYAFAWSDTQISVNVPVTATTGPVKVTVGGFQSPTVPFTVIEGLSITGISPSVGSVGSSVTITGTGFGATQSNSLVTFNSAGASISTWSDTSIVAVVPTAASTGPVTVAVAGSTAIGPTFGLTSGVVLTDSLGHQTTYGSTVVGGKWYVNTSQGSGCSSCPIRGTVSNLYDNFGNVTQRTDALGFITTYTYDTNQNVTSVSAQSGPGTYATTSYTYNNFGEPLTVTDPLGHVTTNTYDTRGNLLTVTTPAPDGSTAASVTQFAYNSLGELTQITDPLSHVTMLTYTTAGLISTITDAQSNVTTYGYDSRGNRTSVTDALLHQTTFAYDAGNRLQTITYADSTTATFNYDTRGRRTSATDQNGKITTYSYDDADRLTSIKDAANNTTTYGYDTENNLTSIQDANGHSTTLSYDALGRVTQTNFPSTLSETYAYDANNNLTTKTDRKGQSITFVYDALNRMTKKQYPNSTEVDYVYDLVGKIQQVNDPTGTYAFAYDNMGRLIGTTTSYSFLAGRNFTTAYTYDKASNRTGFTDPESGSTTYAYDTLNRLTTLTPPAAFTATGSFGFGYDALRRRTSMARPNSVSTTYTYDNLSRLLSVLHKLGASTIDGATYTVDNSGNRLSKTNQVGGITSNYTYDAIYELMTATQGATTTESYTYDAAGNRLSSLGVSPYTNNISNELTSIPSATYTFDNNGNLLTRVNSSGTTTNAWDYDNRLTSVALPGTGGTFNFKYDPFGRRIYKSSSSATSVYVYDRDNLIEETTSTGTATARYTMGLNIDEPLAILQGSTTSYYQADGLGSITSLSNSSGANVEAYTYDSYGNLTASTGSLTNRYRYTGREFDSEIGLYYYRARYYDPATGRFLAEDPVGFKGGINLYAYARSNPINRIDPRGLYDVFGFGALTAATPTPGLRGAGEAVGLVGYNSNGGAYAGDIFALGLEGGGQVNYIGGFVGAESTTSCATPKQIRLKEVALGLEIPFLAGFGFGFGRYNTADEAGYFFFVDGGAIGSNGSLGIGFSSSTKP